MILSINWVYRKWWMPQFMAVLFEQTIWNMDIFWVALFIFRTKTNDISNWCSFFGWWKFFIGKFSHVCSFPLESFDLMHQCIVNSKFRVWSLLTDFYQKMFDFFTVPMFYLWHLAADSWVSRWSFSETRKESSEVQTLNPGESLLIALLPRLFWTYPGIKPES